MKTIEIADARESLRQYAEHGENLPIVVTDHGRPVAALLPVPNADMETVSLSTNPKFLSLIERSRERHGREGGISGTEMRRRLDTVPNNRIERNQGEDRGAAPATQLASDSMGGRRRHRTMHFTGRG